MNKEGHDQPFYEARVVLFESLIYACGFPTISLRAFSFMSYCLHSNIYIRPYT